jgi:hypothetical protein
LMFVCLFELFGLANVKIEDDINVF